MGALSAQVVPQLGGHVPPWWGHSPRARPVSVDDGPSLYLMQERVDLI